MRYSSLPPELIKNWVWQFQFEGPRGPKDPLQLHIEARRLFQEWEAAPGYIFSSCSRLYPRPAAELVQAAYRS